VLLERRRRRYHVVGVGETERDGAVSDALFSLFEFI
jgi:hypothetical protein